MSQLVTFADLTYLKLLETVCLTGEKIETRNAKTFTSFNPAQNAAVFDSFPLVTVRKTQAKKAIQEMEWFVSGEAKCPEALLNWWEGQLNANGELIDGYSQQLRAQAYVQRGAGDFPTDELGIFDQWAFLLEEIKAHPNSRRLCISLWNSGEMFHITRSNKNPKTPACCHGTIIQANVTEGKLNLFVYQRSADLLLGVPHNWVQYWAMLTFLAYHTGFKIGKLFYTFGDLHVYDEPSHIQCAKELLNFKNLQNLYDCSRFKLIYTYSDEVDVRDDFLPAFKASDFSLQGLELFTPITSIKPKLL